MRQLFLPQLLLPLLIIQALTSKGPSNEEADFGLPFDIFSVDVVLQGGKGGVGTPLEFSNLIDSETATNSFCSRFSCAPHQIQQVQNLVDYCKQAGSRFKVPVQAAASCDLRVPIILFHREPLTEFRTLTLPCNHSGSHDAKIAEFCETTTCSPRARVNLIGIYGKGKEADDIGTQASYDSISERIKQSLFPECDTEFWEWTRRFNEPVESIPWVSVVVPIHNAERTLRASMESVNRTAHLLYQSMARDRKSIDVAPTQLVLVDDSSQDASLDIAKDFIQKCNEGGCKSWLSGKVVQSADKIGAGAARNLGVDSGHSTYIAFLDGDDIFLEGHLVMQWKGHQKLDRGVALRSRVELWDGVKDTPLTGVAPKWKSAIENSIPMNLVVRRQAHECVRGYPTTMDVGEDFIYAQKLQTLALHLQLKMAFIESTTVRYNRYPGNSLDRQMDKFSKDW